MRILKGIGALCLLALAVAAVVGIVQSNREQIAGESVGTFAFDLYAENRYTPVGRGLLVSSDAGLSLFDGEGRLLRTDAVNYTSPLTAACGSHAVVWSQSATGATRLNAEGETQDLSLPGNILGADVNESGWTVFLARESGTKGAAIVCKPDGKAVYRVRMGSSYPVDADISPAADSLALLTLQGSGSHVGIYGLSQEAEQYGWTGEEEVFFELEYLQNGNLFLLSADHAVFLNGDGELLQDYAFSDEYLKDYAVSDGGFIALVLGRHRTGSAARLVTLDDSGRELASQEVQWEVESLTAAGRYLSVLYSDRTVIYDSALQETGRLDDTAGIQASLVRSDGSTIIITGSGAAIYEP